VITNLLVDADGAIGACGRIGISTAGTVKGGIVLGGGCRYDPIRNLIDVVWYCCSCNPCEPANTTSAKNPAGN
jgi:hypothetical protein